VECFHASQCDSSKFEVPLRRLIHLVDILFFIIRKLDVIPTSKRLCFCMLLACKQLSRTKDEANADIVPSGSTNRNDAVVLEWGWLPQELIISILSYFDVWTLIQKKEVRRNRRQICTKIVDAKSIKAFKTNQELRIAVRKYFDKCTPDAAEKIAQTYGWPVGKWDVSNLQNFGGIFRGQGTFDEDLSAWSVLNATMMTEMVLESAMLKQDLSYWDVSKVTSKGWMFWGARSFNQDICRCSCL
jgi:hypothetical protein